MECPECKSEIRDDSLFCRVCGKKLQTGQRGGTANTRDVTATPGDLMIGSVFLGRYKIVGELGRGGMGLVYKAEDMRLGRYVALKFLPPDLTRDPQAKERFVHEARAASALDHPGICTVYEIEEADDGRIFISMGCYEGETLKDKIEKGPLDANEAMEIALQVAEGLQEAHDKGIVHRDIKPSNIMVTAKGQAKIMDFGLAKLTGQTRITKAGTTMGTISYMSPEQARGEDIDLRTDIWSLGVVLYEALTGERPFKGEYDQAVVYSILNEEHRPVSEINGDIPHELEAIVDRCLKTVPAERYGSAGELAADLLGLMKRAPGPSQAQRASLLRGPTRRASLLKVGIPAAAIIAALIILSFMPPGRDLLKRFAGEGHVPGTLMKVAVLPCSMVGGSAADTALCNGMAKVLTDKLELLEQFNSGFRVLPVDEVFDLEEKSPIAARRMLGANVVLTGTLDRSPDAMRLRPVRVDFDMNTEVTSTTAAFIERRGDLISDPIANLSTWQDSIVADAAALLGLDIGSKARDLIFAHGTSVPEAYLLFLEGEGFLNPAEGNRRLDRAIQSFSAAIDLDSSYVPAYIGLGSARYRAAYRSGDSLLYERAIEACDQALQRDENCLDAHVTAGYTYFMADEFDKAIGRFQQAIDIDSLSFKARFGMGLVQRYAGHLEEAEAAFLKAADLRPHVPEVYKQLTYMYLAYQGRYREAVESASKLVELKPYSARGYCDLGTAYYSLDLLDEAMAAFEKSLSVDSTYGACANLGTIYFSRMRYADAARMYKAALRFGEGNYRVIGFLAEAYYWSPGRRDLAMDTFRQAIDALDRQGVLDETNATHLSDLASYYARIGESAKSESLLAKATSLEPSAALTLIRIADTYEQLGEREAALEWLGKALDKGAPLEAMDDFPGMREMRTDSRYRQLLRNRRPQS